MRIVAKGAVLGARLVTPCSPTLAGRGIISATSPHTPREESDEHDRGADRRDEIQSGSHAEDAVDGRGRAQPTCRAVLSPWARSGAAGLATDAYWYHRGIVRQRAAGAPQAAGLFRILRPLSRRQHA